MKKLTFIAAIFSMMYLSSCGESKTNEENTEEVSVEQEATMEQEVEETESSSDDGDLIGTWKLSDVKLDMVIPEEQKEMFDGMMNAMKESTSMTFNSDGTFDSKSKVMGQEKNESGEWSLDGMTLVSTNNEGRNDTVTLTELSSSTFTIEVGEGDKKMTMTFSK